MGAEPEAISATEAAPGLQPGRMRAAVAAPRLMGEPGRG